MGEPKPVMIDGELLDEAEALGVEVRELIERELRRRIEGKRMAQVWESTNRDFVESYNRYIEQYGLVGEEYRRHG